MNQSKGQTQVGAANLQFRSGAAFTRARAPAGRPQLATRHHEQRHQAAEAVRPPTAKAQRSSCGSTSRGLREELSRRVHSKRSSSMSNTRVARGGMPHAGKPASPYATCNTGREHRAPLSMKLSARKPPGPSTTLSPTLTDLVSCRDLSRLASRHGCNALVPRLLWVSTDTIVSGIGEPVLPRLGAG